MTEKERCLASLYNSLEEDQKEIFFLSLVDSYEQGMNKSLETIFSKKPVEITDSRTLAVLYVKDLLWMK